MFCPKCKTEYREGFTACADCGETLVRELPKEAEPEFVPADWQRLMTVTDDMEAAMIASFLDTENIPVYKKPIGIGAYLQVYTGDTRMGVQILIPKDCLEHAIEILEVFRATEMPEIIDDEDEEELDEPKSRTRIRPVFLFLVILIFILPSLFWSISFILSRIFGW